MTKVFVVLLTLLAWQAGAQAYPEQRRDSILALITGAQISPRVINMAKAGAKGDGRTDCRSAFEKAMRRAERQGGARIVVPAGTYLIKGPVRLVSNVCLDLQEGATLKFDPEAKWYLPVVKTSWEGTFLQNYSPMIYGYGLHDVAIVGKGSIDGNCRETFATWREKQDKGKTLSRQMNHQGVPISDRNFGEGYWLRPHLIQLFNCRNITIADVFITDSPFWCVHLLKSENAICRGIRYDAKLVNNDGIDPECSRNILIENVHFNNGDDNIAIKSGRDNDGWNFGTPSENIIIRKCHFKGLHAVVLGSEMSGGVRNVFIEDCDYAGYCKRGIYIKTNPDRGGFVSNLYVRNVKFGEVEDLIYVTSRYAGEGLDNHHFSKIENLHFDRISCTRAKGAGIVLQGTGQNPIRNVLLRRIDIGQVQNALSFDHVENVQFGDCHLGGEAGIPTQVSPKDQLFDQP